jgi:hypothetical protein
MKNPFKKKSSGTNETVPMACTSIAAFRVLKVFVEERASLQGSKPSAGEISCSVNLSLIETSSVETDLSGGVYLVERENLLTWKFATPFLFTCRTLDGRKYDLTWSSSLS